MNFDPKYLVRWGIPGWIYLFIITVYLFMVDYNTIIGIIFNENAPVIVASISLFIGAGIIIGNIMHQISMSLGFVIWTKRKKFFKSEYDMDLKIIKNDYGKDIQRIYSYRLGNVHALRALWFSLLLSLLTILSLSFIYSISMKVWVLIIIVVVINLIVLNNWRYFQNNLDYFLRKIKSDFQ